MIQCSFYEELKHVFDHFPKYSMTTMLEDFKVKLERQDIFKPTIGNQDNNDIEVRIANFAT